MNRRIALIAAAVVLALLGTVAVYSYANHADQRAVAADKAVTVLIAAQSLPAGTTWSDAVKNNLVKTETIPASSAPSSALHSTADATVEPSEVAVSDVAAGQIVLSEMFGTQAAAATGVLTIPSGKIAVSVSLNGNADVAGFVEPKSQVIVFVTSNVTLGKNDQQMQSSYGTLSVTKTVLSRATVIATSQAAPTDLSGSKSGGTSVGSVLVTLAVSQLDAERLIEAQNAGQLYLGLLSDSSQVSAADQGTINVADIRSAQAFLK